jgi:hypothetical protein
MKKFNDSLFNQIILFTLINAIFAIIFDLIFEFPKKYLILMNLAIYITFFIQLQFKLHKISKVFILFSILISLVWAISFMLFEFGGFWVKIILNFSIVLSLVFLYFFAEKLQK